jgi:hypothetical protein
LARGQRRTARTIRIEGWDLDEANVEELSAHGISVEILEQVATEAPRFRWNKKRRAATHQMIGPDRGGGFWVICMLESRLFIWRPITGWPAGEPEIEWWRRSK